MRALVRAWWLMPTVLVLGGAVWWMAAQARAVRAAVRAQRHAELAFTLAQIDAMAPDVFESAVAELMIRDAIAAQPLRDHHDRPLEEIDDQRTHPTVTIRRPP
ncbi:hypothetical protein [Actinomadura coerulea]|uniref:hypothetical protein n=1 Tax=Actinomadura coerulea TaxID=46159 RepID=UPI003437B1F4